MLVGCAKKDEPIDLPPKLSFVVDYSTYPDDQSVADQQPTEKGEALLVYPGYAPVLGSYRADATVNVVVWKVITDVAVFFPRLAFLTAFSKKPTQADDGWWEWKFNYWLIYSANLRGRVNGDHVEWEMYMSKSGANAYTDFKWFYGSHNIGATSGTWTLKKGPFNDYDFLSIDWTRNSDGTSTIKYTNIIDAASTATDAEKNNAGEYIEYGSLSTPDIYGYNAYFNINLKDDASPYAAHLQEIKWHITDKDGRIRDPKNYGDSAWYCWDTTGVDMTCPTS